MRESHIDLNHCTVLIVACILMYALSLFIGVPTYVTIVQSGM